MVGWLARKKIAWGGIEYVKYTGGDVTAPCLDIFFYHVQVDDMHHRVGALVVVDFQLHPPVGVVYLHYFHLAWELKAVDTQYLCHPPDRRVISDTTSFLH